MKTKADHLLDRLDGPAEDPLVRFGLALSHLKNLYRQGWLRVGVPDLAAESVAEHSYSLAVLAMVVRDRFFPQLDSDRLLRLALLHDLGEIHAGDITPHHGVPPEEKRTRERQALARLFEGFPGGETYRALWEEYEAQSSPEAILIRQLDRLEMALQACVYEHVHHLDLEEFFESAGRAQTWSELRELLARIMARRPPRPPSGSA